VQAIRVVAAGDALLSPSVTRKVVADYARRAPSGSPATAYEHLTRRELEILQLLACGMNNAELAAELYLGEGTVKTHVSSVLAKLGLRDRVQAVVYAYENGLVDRRRI
jgi:DNA-binding NarL/FixJ family response regulator